MSLYKWRENTNPKGYRYIKEKNTYGDEIIRFERYDADKISLLSV